MKHIVLDVSVTPPRHRQPTTDSNKGPSLDATGLIYSRVVLFLALCGFFLSLQRFLLGPEGFFLGLWEVQTVVNRRHSLAELEVDSDIYAIAELLCRIRD